MPKDKKYLPKLINSLGYNSVEGCGTRDFDLRAKTKKLHQLFRQVGSSVPYTEEIFGCLNVIQNKGNLYNRNFIDNFATYVS